ncbi:MAG: protoporphyrinogen oxidase [Acidobacteriota bacterium]|nr:protoporphyrinogen oxidase [Acidobacteriota bacterium]
MNLAPRPRIAIIGGGISGLTAAYQLTRRASHQSPLEVLLLEAAARLGGTIRTHWRDGFLLEGGPDAFISEKPEALQLAKQLGLESELIETNDAHRRAFIVRGGKLRPVPEGFQLLAPSRFWSFAATDIFSWPGKARMALDLFLPKRAGANAEDDESLAGFVRRRFGREALERMAQPMVGGIYTADPEQLSLRATMPRFLDMEREHRSVIRALWKARRRVGEKLSRDTSGARYSMFLSFKEGMQALTDKLAGEFPPDCVQLNAKVEQLAFDRETNRWQLNIDGGASLAADAVCIALPAHAAAKLLRATDAEIAAELDQIPYASTATVNLAYRRADIPHPLDGFGFVVPFVEKRATLACSFSSVKFSDRAPEGHALLRAFVGGALQPEMFALDEEEMIRAVREDLRQLLGIERPPLFAHVERWPRSMAQYHVGHAERVARIRQRLAQFPTLRLAGNAYNGAGIPDCIRSGGQAADALLSQLIPSYKTG